MDLLDIIKKSNKVDPKDWIIAAMFFNLDMYINKQRHNCCNIYIYINDKNKIYYDRIVIYSEDDLIYDSLNSDIKKSRIVKSFKNSRYSEVYNAYKKAKNMFSDLMIDIKHNLSPEGKKLLDFKSYCFNVTNYSKYSIDHLYVSCIVFENRDNTKDINFYLNKKIIIDTSSITITSDEFKEKQTDTFIEERIKERISYNKQINSNLVDRKTKYDNILEPNKYDLDKIDKFKKRIEYRKQAIEILSKYKHQPDLIYQIQP